MAEEWKKALFSLEADFSELLKSYVRFVPQLKSSKVFILETTGSKNVRAYDICEDIGICDHVENYPTELVNGLITELKSKNTMFNKDEDDFGPSIFRVRFNYREELCDFTTKQIIPQRAKDNNGVMRFIINDKKKPVQKFNIATCNKREERCNDFLGFALNYKGVCIQNTALRQMIYVNEKNQSATGYFRVPVCCSCKIVRIN